MSRMAPRVRRTGYTPWLPPPSTQHGPADATAVQADDGDASAPATAPAAAAGPQPEAPPDDDDNDGGDDDDLDKLLDMYSDAAQQQVAELNRSSASAAAPRSMKALRDAGLTTPLPPDNKGFRMMQRMGFQAGAGLGRGQQGRSEPVPLDMRAPRTGLGVHEDHKRAQEAAQQEAAARDQKRARHAAVQYQQYQRTAAGSFSGRRVRGQLAAARAACEALDARAGTEATSVLRQLEPPDEGAEDGEAGVAAESIAAESTQEELAPEEQLGLLVEYLRGVHLYCTFCGCQYRDEDDLGENCPGPLEDDH